MRKKANIRFSYLLYPAEKSCPLDQKKCLFHLMLVTSISDTTESFLNMLTVSCG